MASVANSIFLCIAYIEIYSTLLCIFFKAYFYMSALFYQFYPSLSSPTTNSKVNVRISSVRGRRPDTRESIAVKTQIWIAGTQLALRTPTKWPFNRINSRKQGRKLQVNGGHLGEKENKLDQKDLQPQLRKAKLKNLIGNLLIFRVTSLVTCHLHFSYPWQIFSRTCVLTSPADLL